MYRVEYLVVKLLFVLFQNISLGTGKKIASVIYYFTYKLIRYRRKVIISNLNLVYGKNLPKPLNYLLKEIYKNFIYLWMEFLQNNKVTRENIEKIFTIHDEDIFNKAYQQGKGVILISGHMGNFEWLGQMHGQLDHKIFGIAKKQRNPLVNRLVEKIRLRKNLGLIYTRNAMNDGIRELKKQNLLAIVMDQDAKSRGVFVDFLGIPSSTAVGPAVFHLRTGAPIIFLVSVRKDYGKFDAYYEEICPVSEPAEVNEYNIRKITQKQSDVLSKWVRQYPEQWFWMHRRWKTRLEIQNLN